ncbi:organic cation/carnitine transporter 7 [Phtheirospermum japonicum]|uniref:Organic cation/carnitine transporter 7 n=1 Tax=Phtheirospermum japonicum TaxID=374723 RepID=A0A830D933_9LAMI|nr:organic cation/carnitine transporter 7 [Phtheirospermum japonicum]
MRDPNPVYTLDEALETVGFGKYQGLLLAYGAFGWIADAMEMMILSFIGSAVQSEWDLSPSQKSLISTVVFAGMLVGAYSWGVISDSYGRKKGILGVVTVTAVAGLLSAFSPNYASLIIFRCVAGVGLGGMNIMNSWFLEFVPTSNRGAWMIAFSSFWTVGTIFEAALAWFLAMFYKPDGTSWIDQLSANQWSVQSQKLIIMPRFGWRWFVALSSGPSFIMLLFYGLTPESPRFLCKKGRFNEAHDILEKAALINGTMLQTGLLVSDQMRDRNDDFAASETSHLLSPTEENTYSFKSSSSSLDQSTCTSGLLNSVKSQNASLYIDVFVTSLAEVPGLIFAAFIVDRFGRKLSMAIMFVLSAVLLIPLLTHQNEILTTGLLFGTRAFVSAAFIVACIYAPEVYPTEVRTTAVGTASAIGRIGGMICPLVAVGLVSACQQAYAVILFQVMILLCALCVLLTPVETNGRHLA